MQALVNSGSEINAITLGYTSKLSLKIRQINIEVQKIDGSTFKIIEMILASF